MNDFEELVMIDGLGVDESIESDHEIEVLRIEYRTKNNRGLRLMKPSLEFKIGDSKWWPIKDLVLAADSLRERHED